MASAFSVACSRGPGGDRIDTDLGANTSAGTETDDSDSAPPLPPTLPGAVFDESGRATWLPTDLTVTALYTGCFGICPGYTVTLRVDLSARYEGHVCVEHGGPVDTVVDEAAFRSIVERLAGLRVFDLAPRLEALADISDYTETWLTVTSGGETVTTVDPRGFDPGISEDFVVPDWLAQFRVVEDDIARSIDAAQWVGSIDWGDTGLTVECETSL